MRELFPLPPIREQVERLKRPAGVPNVASFNAKQHEVMAGLLAWYNKPGGGIALLEGMAGTGKTHISSRFVEQILHMNWNHKIAYTATTNKAVKVSYTMAEFYHTNLVYSTLHSLLALKETIRYDGSIDFIPDKWVQPGIVDCALVIVEESSMLQDKLFGYLQPYIIMGCKVLFVGDGCQALPVKSHIRAIPFNTIKQRQYNIEVFTLTEIVRQAAGNPIIQFTTAIRNDLNRSRSFKSLYKEDMVNEGHGVYFIRRNQQEEREYFDALLRHVFTSPNFVESADFAKVLGYTNKTVNFINAAVRRMIYGTRKLRRVELGEKLIAAEPVFDYEGRVMISNSEELQVVEFEKKYQDVNGGQHTLTYYDTLVTYFDMVGKPVDKHINILSDLGQIEADKILAQLATIPAMHTPGSIPWSKAWKEFYAFKRKFASINYSYAITSHKAQGSTYDNAIVLEGDISTIRMPKERNQLFYTAASRPRHRLFIL